MFGPYQPSIHSYPHYHTQFALKYELRTPFIAITLFNFHHKTCCVFILHVTNKNRHHFIIDCINHMADEGYLVMNMFHMIKYDPKCLEVTTNLHPLHQITSTTISIHKHFEHKQFFSKLLSLEKNYLECSRNHYWLWKLEW
jgi:hypothetical protein